MAIVPSCFQTLQRTGGSPLLHAALLIWLLAAIPAIAMERPAVVDLELVLAVDVSSSIDQSEARIQRDGYAAAFADPDLIRWTEAGPQGAIAVTYLEWAGPKHHKVVVPWEIIRGQADAQRFASELRKAPIESSTGTSISAGLLTAAALLGSSPTKGLRRVIDISGDGINNAGRPVASVRDALVRRGITINGLPVAVHQSAAQEVQSFDADYLESYYEHCVIGGPDAFTITVTDMELFGEAIRRKLIREIAVVTPKLELAAFRSVATSDFDCSSIADRTGR